MLANNPYQKYKTQQVQTSQPHELISLLYEAAIKNLTQAKAYIEKRDIAQSSETIMKTQAIVLELRASLDKTVGEIAEQLDSLYEYFYNRLLEANTKKDLGIVDEILQFFKELRQTWEEAIRLAKANR